jgi:hypothetical protein
LGQFEDTHMTDSEIEAVKRAALRELWREDKRKAAAKRKANVQAPAAQLPNTWSTGAEAAERLGWTKK